MLDVIMIHINSVSFVLEVSSIKNILSFQETDGLVLIDPAPEFGLTMDDTPHIGLLAHDGPPTGLLLGRYKGIEHWGKERITMLPQWIVAHRSSLLYPACSIDQDGKLVWLINTQAILSFVPSTPPS